MQWPRKESGRRSAATARRPRTTDDRRRALFKSGRREIGERHSAIKCRAPSRIRVSRMAKRSTNRPVREDKPGRLKDVVRKPSPTRRLARFDSAANGFNDIITKLLFARLPIYGAT